MRAKDNIRVLISPLDWGLGHATRCIPIIRYLLEKKCEVVIATGGAQKKLLETEFSQVLFLSLKGYEIKYSKNKRLLPLKILCQLPKLLNSITNERKWLKRVVHEYAIDAIISDNRFGLWHPDIPAIFITHQLQIKGHTKWIETLLRIINYHHINKFTFCWVPDFESPPNIAGILSHPVQRPRTPVKYIGALTRFQVKTVPIIYDVLVIISGPEPQRTLLENILLAQLKQFTGTLLFVRGLPGESRLPASFNQVHFANHLNAADLELAFNASNLVISRAGYTTVMDIIKLRKKAVLIPTPGQTEQEYLANHLLRQQICLAIEQAAFNLNAAIAKANAFYYKLPTFNMELYKNELDNFISSLQA